MRRAAAFCNLLYVVQQRVTVVRATRNERLASSSAVCDQTTGRVLSVSVERGRTKHSDMGGHCHVKNDARRLSNLVTR